MGAVTDIYNRRIPMTLQSWKVGRRVLVAAVLIIALAAYLFHGGSSGAQYVTTLASQGEIVQAVTATGDRQSCHDGTSWQLCIGTDRPDAVRLSIPRSKRASLCAKIDPRTYQNTLDQAQANLANAVAQLQKDKATLAYARVTYERDPEAHRRACHIERCTR